MRAGLPSSSRMCSLTWTAGAMSNRIGKCVDEATGCRRRAQLEPETGVLAAGVAAVHLQDPVFHFQAREGSQQRLGIVHHQIEVAFLDLADRLNLGGPGRSSSDDAAASRWDSRSAARPFRPLGVDRLDEEDPPALFDQVGPRRAGQHLERAVANLDPRETVPIETAWSPTTAAFLFRFCGRPERVAVVLR